MAKQEEKLTDYRKMKRYIRWILIITVVAVTPFLFRAGWLYAFFVPPSNPEYSRADCAIRIYTTYPEKYVENDKVDRNFDFPIFALYHSVEQHRFGREFLNLLQGRIYPIFSSTGAKPQKTAAGYRQETRYILDNLCDDKEPAFRQLIDDYHDIVVRDVIIEIDTGPFPRDFFARACPISGWWTDGKLACK